MLEYQKKVRGTYQLLGIKEWTSQNTKEGK